MLLADANGPILSPTPTATPSATPTSLPIVTGDPLPTAIVSVPPTNGIVPPNYDNCLSWMLILILVLTAIGVIATLYFSNKE